jgi:formate dehydrogenase gamma subunit
MWTVASCAWATLAAWSWGPQQYNAFSRLDGYPSATLQVDRTRAALLGVLPAAVYATLQANLGSQCWCRTRPSSANGSTTSTGCTCAALLRRAGTAAQLIGATAMRQPPGTLVRCGPSTRINHWITAGTMILLVLSGLALLLPVLFFLTGLFGGGQPTRAVHPWLGVVLVISFGVLFVQVWRDNLWTPADLAWLRAVRYVLSNDEEHMPEVGRYNAGQKLVFWAMTVLILMLFVTGLIIWATDGVIHWRRSDLGRKIAQTFGVHLHERSVGKLLHRLGFRHLSVRPRHPQADSSAQEAHKELCHTGR